MFSKTVDSVLKNFHKVIKDLESVAATNTSKASDLRGAADLMLSDAEIAEKESAKATKIADKLKKLLSED